VTRSPGSTVPGMSVLRRDPDETPADRIRRILFWILVLAAAAIVFYAVTAKQGASEVPGGGY
jgi:hypothetical protein